MKKKYIIYILPVFMILMIAAGNPVIMESAGRTLKKASAAVPIDMDWHKIGTLWMRITNFSMIGDDTYEGRTPSADWPGGSGNSYLYRGSLWLTGTRNGIRGTSTTEDKEFTPLDEVHKETFLGDLAEHSWTKFTDAIKVSDAHIPLGLEVTQHTYAYGVSFADDFILYRYYLKNVGVDTTGDGIVDDTSDLKDVFFTFRMDGDVSKLLTWPTESNFSNRDDHAMCLTHTTTAGKTDWDELKLFPYMQYQINSDPAVWDYIQNWVGDSTLTIMFDGDYSGVPSEVDTSLLNRGTVSGSYLYAHPDDDFGNPNPTGIYQTPGILAMKMLRTNPLMKPRSYTTSKIGMDFSDDDAQWTNAIGKTGDKAFDKLLKNPSPPFGNGKVNEGDYRAITTYGPVETLAYGDSIEVVFAVGVSADAQRAGIYSFTQLLENMDVAKFIVDEDYQIDVNEIPPKTEITIDAVEDDEGNFKGANISWDPAPALNHPNFQEFVLAKFKERTAAGFPIYDTLMVLDGTQAQALLDASTNGLLGYYDAEIQFGYDYTFNLFVKGHSDKYYDVEVVSSDFITATGKAVVNTMDEIRVVPNPFRGSVRWNNRTPAPSSPWKDRLFFINLPEDAIVRIFTLDGDLVQTIRPSDVRAIENAAQTNAATAEWDLISRNNREVAPGIYLYHVTSEMGEKVGKFVILK